MSVIPGLVIDVKIAKIEAIRSGFCGKKVKRVIFSKDKL
jgi:hypothetical protein